MRDNDRVPERERAVQVSKSNSHPSTNAHLGQKCQSTMGEEGSVGESGESVESRSMGENGLSE